MKMIIIVFILALSACASSAPPAVTPSHMITLPGQGSMVILGMAARQSSRANEIALAKETAARKASMYHRVFAGKVERSYVGIGYFDYIQDSQTWVEYDQLLERYMDRLSFDEDKDIFRDANGNVFIRFTYPVSFPERINYQPLRDNIGRPEWVSKPPAEISGFKAGVGRSGRLDRFTDTVTKSYEAAAVAIASRISTVVTTEDITIYNQSSQNISSRSEAVMTNFLVLETWIDPQTRAVYTLAIAR